MNKEQKRLLQHISLLCEYWAKQQGTDLDRCKGVAFSILVTLDGGSGDLNGYALKPLIPNDDKETMEEGEDIAGCLHEFFGKENDDE